MINVITTFSGYDSQCLALRKAGIEFDLVAWAEFDPQSKQPLEKQPAVIAHNLLFPEYKDRNLGDMAKADWQKFKGIDIDLFHLLIPLYRHITGWTDEGLVEGFWHSLILSMVLRVCNLHAPTKVSAYGECQKPRIKDVHARL